MKAVAVVLTAFALALPEAARATQQAVPEGAVPMAQDTPPPGPMRPGMMMQDSARLQMLRQQIQRRFGQMVQQELQLSEPQMQQLRGAVRAHMDRRADLARRQQAVNQAIRFQMRPGIAADRDSLSKLLDAQTHLRVEHAQQEEQLERDLTFLNPVQRARFMQMLRTFEQRIQEIRMRQMMRMRGMGPGGGPGAFGPRPMQPPGRPLR